MKAELPILHIKMLLNYVSLILRKKNPQWDRKSGDDHGSTTRVLFTEENTDGEF